MEAGVRAGLPLPLMQLLQLLLLLGAAAPSHGRCSRPLGLTSRAVRNWQLSASSSQPSYLDPSCNVKYARLHQAGSRAWCPRPESHEPWLLVDLGVTAQVTGVMTQGRASVNSYTSKYAVSYSQDAYHWEDVRDHKGKRKVFPGNRDSHTVRHNYLEPAVDARFVRVHVLEWKGQGPALRLELVGCQGTLLEQTECNQIVSVEPYTKLSASSHPTWYEKYTCQPDDSSVFGHRAWCPKFHNEHQWLKFDLGPPILVVGVITKGQPDVPASWVTAYTVDYSNDSLVWFTYTEGNHYQPKIFGGNMDKDTERRHYLNQPFTARFVRVKPTYWDGRPIGLRAAILGCPHRGPCPLGFLRVTPSARCVPNLAYGKTTWVNDKRQGWKDWTYGHSALAVDGDKDTSLSRCAILDNYYVEQPIWMVDLGWQENILGVIVTTWQGSGQDSNILYHDYLMGLDRLTVYVSDRSHLASYELSPPGSNVTRCASVNRGDSAVFQPRLHLDCGQTLTGRYVYVKGVGATGRHKHGFSVVLCEVEVY